MMTEPFLQLLKNLWFKILIVLSNEITMSKPKFSDPRQTIMANVKLW